MEPGDEILGATSHSPVTLDEIRDTALRLRPYIRSTPLVTLWPSGLTVKAENLHPTGAFKIRGAFNAILALSAEVRGRGVIAHSSGNHAMAVAFAARRLGVRATVVMPHDAPRLKREGVQQLGADLVLVGPASDERMARADALARAHGYSPIEPYDADAIIAATGVIGLEILDALPSVEQLYVPVSGGGLIAGVTLAVKLARPEVRVIGVEPERAADAHASFHSGQLTSLTPTAEPTIADGLRVSVLGQRNWPIVQHLVDDIVTVSEAEIIAGIGRIAREARLIAEPSGSTAIAAALRTPRGDLDNTVAILSGGNVDPGLLASTITGSEA